MDQLEHRKARARLRLLNPDGTPAAYARVKADQRTHQFLFGCGAFDAVAMMKTPDEERKAFLLERMNKWLGLFNYGTLPFYWGRYEPEERRTAYSETMAGARWLRERGVTLKGHPLCWHTACAPWLLKYSNEEILRRQLERIRRDVAAFRDVIGLWDVINEVVIMPVFDRYDNAVTRICKRYGRVNLVKEVFDAAKAANPNALLLINDFNLSEKYAELIRDSLDAGAPIGAIGLQTHQHQGYMGQAKLEEILRRFEGFGLPLHFTENTLVSGHLMPGHIVDLNDYQIPEWPTTPEGEERQAKEWEEMYRIVFAHPLVKAMTGWDFADGAWLGAPSGVIAADNRIKPAYRTLEKLIHGEWETHCELVTDENGRAEAVGFKGSYALSDGERTGCVTLADGADAAEVTLA